MAARELHIRPLTGLPELHEGDDLGALIAAAATPRTGDVVVISQKAVSKVEGRVRRLGDGEPGQRAVELAGQLGKEPALGGVRLSGGAPIGPAQRGVLI